MKFEENRKYQIEKLNREKPLRQKIQLNEKE